jgi:hypothetical protein
MDEEKNKKLEFYAWSSNGLIKFVGSRRFPFDSSRIDQDSPLLSNVGTGSIVEFVYSFQSNLLVPTKIRSEKSKPNRIEFVIDNWNLIFDGITEDTLSGKDFKLLRKYFNRIKFSLFDRIKTFLYVIDIGSGRGGDVNKIDRFEKVLFVEPNEEHIEELVLRLKKRFSIEVPVIRPNESVPNVDRFLILSTVGQDWESISRVSFSFFGQRKADAIVSMLSMSFLWDSEETVKLFQKTIEENLKKNGYFFFLTIDGDATRSLFSSLQKKSINEIKIGPAYLRQEDERKLFISISDTIVSSQTEYLVYPFDLQSNNLQIEKELLPEEELLNESERQFSSLYIQGYGKRI